ncbi:MAG TPA: rRNA maturation RNase YbeY [Actinomycetota bacterium]|nr:rRNA maturation RNase YbeY [Actinomycetota bacterium]
MSDEGDSPTVALSDRQGRAVDGTALVELARRALVAEGAADVELSVSLVSEDEMARLHETYLGEPGPTDVLSFPQDEEGPGRLLGDVVICPDVAARQATDLHRELGLLVVHGTLHLLGYDHEEPEDRRRMWERQEAYSGVALADDGSREASA